MFSFCQTALCTGRCHSFVRYDRMTFCRCGLCFHFVAILAGILYLAGSHTSCFPDLFLIAPLMPCRRNDFCCILCITVQTVDQPLSVLCTGCHFHQFFLILIRNMFAVFCLLASCLIRKNRPRYGCQTHNCCGCNTQHPFPYFFFHPSPPILFPMLCLLSFFRSHHCFKSPMRLHDGIFYQFLCDRLQIHL